MREFYLQKRKTIKLLCFVFFFCLIAQSNNNFGIALSAEKEIKSNIKGSETFSQDWVQNQSHKIKEENTNIKKFSIEEINDKDIDPIAFQQTEDSSDPSFEDFSSDDVNLTGEDPEMQNIKGGVTDLRATVGKSQIIQFAQPIKRLSITDPSLADLILLSPTQMILNGKAAGVTSLIIWDETDQPAFFDLYVLNDTSDLLDAFKQIAPDEPFNIKITDDGNVILSGTVSSTIIRDQAAKICEAYGYKLVDVAESPAPQVVLELRVAEIARSLRKNFNLVYKFASWADVSVAPDGFTSSPRDPNGGIGGDWIGTEVNGFRFALFKPNARVSAFFGMAASKGLLNILAEPKIVSTNGREAVFDAGQQVPVPTGVDQNGNLAYEYKDVGVKVTFTPWISEKSQRIELKLNPEVSEIDPSLTIAQNDGTRIFGFRKRSAQTTVELENGETLMIAGLITRSDTNSYIQPPFFGNIPIIGKLLQSSNFEQSETELVIMVTPKIVKPGEYGEILGTAE